MDLRTTLIFMDFLPIYPVDASHWLDIFAGFGHGSRARLSCLILLDDMMNESHFYKDKGEMVHNMMPEIRSSRPYPLILTL